MCRTMGRSRSRCKRLAVSRRLPLDPPARHSAVATSAAHLMRRLAGSCRFLAFHFLRVLAEAGSAVTQGAVMESLLCA